MKVVVKKTIELSCDERDSITAIFNRVFQKKESPVDFFRKYFWTKSEGSYHALMICDEGIVGCYSVIPYKYRFFEREIWFGLSVDTMIDENYRGSPFNLKKMATAVYDKLVLDGVSFVFGFPNENVYLVRKKILKWVDVGSLDFYVLPIRIGQLKASLKFACWVSRFLAYMMVQYAQHAAIKAATQPRYKIQMSGANAEDYISRRFDRDYKVVKDEAGYFAYRTSFEDNAYVAYIVDVQPLEQARLEQAVSSIYKNEGHVDAIIYVGKLPFRVRNLIRLPQKYAPKAIRMSGLILDRSKVDERVFVMSNWQVGLANFDVR
jgi:hypothetical protein